MIEVEAAFVLVLKAEAQRTFAHVRPVRTRRECLRRERQLTALRRVLVGFADYDRDRRVRDRGYGSRVAIASREQLDQACGEPGLHASNVVALFVVHLENGVLGAKLYAITRSQLENNRRLSRPYQRREPGLTGLLDE